jgi:hypothetical protein
LTAARAASSKKTKGVKTALEEIAKLFLDVARDTAAVLIVGFGEERLQMPSYQLIENGVGGSMLDVLGGRSRATRHASAWLASCRYKPRQFQAPPMWRP